MEKSDQKVHVVHVFLKSFSSVGESAQIDENRDELAVQTSPQ